MACILIGTSGWSYRSWRGPFFPKPVMARHHLQFYATQFLTAELNGVFYRTPSLDTVRGWRDATPDDFVFSWKASKYITHWKRLSTRSHDSLSLIEQRLKILGPKGGPVLFQLPPRFAVNLDRLDSFMRLVPGHWRTVFEFRNPGWYRNDVFQLLRKHDAALCISDHHDAPAPWKTTASFVYVRGHGPTGRYKGHYSDAALRGWSCKIAAWKRRGKDVYVYFDNDQKSAAPADAARLARIIDD